MISVYHWRFADIKMSVNLSLLGALLLCSFKTMIGCCHSFATLWLSRKSYENFRVASSKKESRGSILHLTLWRKWIFLTKTILEKSTSMPWFVNFLGPELYFARVRYLSRNRTLFRSGSLSFKDPNNKFTLVPPPCKQWQAVKIATIAGIL